MLAAAPSVLESYTTSDAQTKREQRFYPLGELDQAKEARLAMDKSMPIEQHQTEPTEKNVEATPVRLRYHHKLGS